MGKYYRRVIGICYNDMQYPKLHKNYNDKNGDIIYKLPKDGAVKAGWINTILKGKKQVIQESLHTFVTASLLD